MGMNATEGQEEEKGKKRMYTFQSVGIIEKSTSEGRLGGKAQWISGARAVQAERTGRERPAAEVCLAGMWDQQGGK